YTAGSGSICHLRISSDTAKRLVKRSPATSGGPPTSIAITNRLSSRHMLVLNNSQPGKSIAVAVSHFLRSLDQNKSIREADQPGVAATYMVSSTARAHDRS